MTVEEIRKSAEPKHECECEKLQEQLNALKADYDNLMELHDEINDENANLRGQVKALKFAIKRLTK